MEASMTIGTEHSQVARLFMSQVLVRSVMDFQAIGGVANLTTISGSPPRFVPALAPCRGAEILPIVDVARQ
jgi:hypothetical protein